MRAYFGGLGAPNDVPAAANAFSAAFIADIEAAPFLKEQLVRGRLTKDSLTRIVLRDLQGGLKGYRAGPPLFPNLRAVATEFLAQEARPVHGAGMGQWDAIAGVIGAAAGAASSIYSAKVNTDLQKQLLSLEQQKQKTAIQIAQLQANQAQTQLAAANVAATGLPAPIAEVLQSVGGWPVVGTAAAAIAIGVAVYLSRRR